MRVSEESPLETKAETESGKSTISAKNCFKAYCKSSTVKKQLVSYCKSQKKYKNCDGLTYHDTFTKNKLNKKATYKFKGGIKYDEKHAKIKPYSLNALDGYWDNGQSIKGDVQTLDTTITRSSTVSWATTTSFQFSEEVSVEVTEKIPEVAEEKTSVTAGFQVGTSSSTSQSHTTSQDYSVKQTISIAPKKCTKWCVYEANNQYEVPYSLTGEYKGSGELKSNAFMCCYTRPGGDSSCSWGGHGSGGTGTYGWMAEDTAGAAVSWASKQGHDTCPQLSASGSSAKFSLPGKFVAGLKTTANVRTFEKGVGQCEKYKCPKASGISNEPEGESTVIAV